MSETATIPDEQLEKLADLIADKLLEKLKTKNLVFSTDLAERLSINKRTIDRMRKAGKLL